LKTTSQKTQKLVERELIREKESCRSLVVEKVAEEGETQDSQRKKKEREEREIKDISVNLDLINH